MIKKTTSLLSIVIAAIWLLFLLPDISGAQSQVNIIEADRAEGGTVDGQTVRKILGNVVMATDDMEMEADSAYQFIGQNMLQAFNIQIETERRTIWADTIYHDTETDFSELRGRVIVQSEQNTVFSEAMDVSMPLDLVFFNTPVRFEDERGTLLAESGIYFQELDSAIFRGNVQLTDSLQYLESDSLFMNRSADAYELYSRVYAHDVEEDVTFAGEYLQADSTGYRLLTADEDAWLMQLNEEKTDTTHLLAQKIELQETDTVSYMDAFQNVRIWSPKFSAIADTANYRDDLDQFILRAGPGPIVWQKNIQLTGPTIEAWMENDNIHFLSSYPRPIAVQEDTLTGRLHQMTGDTLHAYFDEGTIEEIIVFDNSEIIFHQRDENDEPDGLIELISTGPSTMEFLEGDFDFFKAEQDIDGSYLPEDPENIDRQLDNFRWDPNLKPEKPPVRIPRLPEIPEDRAFELPPRYVRYLENRSEI